MSSLSKHAHLFTDGGARGNPGPAAIGIVLIADNQIIKEYNAYIGTATNNQAEYQAILKGLSLAKDIGYNELSCYLDSELVVKQLNRQYKIKEPTLAKLFVKVFNQLSGFKTVTFTHIPRARNRRADKLVNQALDDWVKSGTGL